MPRRTSDAISVDAALIAAASAVRIRRAAAWSTRRSSSLIARRCTRPRGFVTSRRVGTLSGTSLMALGRAAAWSTAAVSCPAAHAAAPTGSRPTAASVGRCGAVTRFPAGDPRRAIAARLVDVAGGRSSEAEAAPSSVRLGPASDGVCVALGRLLAPSSSGTAWARLFGRRAPTPFFFCVMPKAQAHAPRARASPKAGSTAP